MERPSIIYTNGGMLALPGSGDAIVVNTRWQTVSRGRVTARFTRSEHRMLACLIAAPPLLLKRDLLQALYGDDASGGPDNPVNLCYVRLAHMRARLTQLGITVRFRHHFGIETTIQPLVADVFREAA